MLPFFYSLDRLGFTTKKGRVFPLSVFPHEEPSAYLVKMTLQNRPFYFLKYIPWNGSIYSGDKKKDISLEMKKWTRMTVYIKKWRSI